MTSFDTSPQLNVWRALLALAVVFVMLATTGWTALRTQRGSTALQASLSEWEHGRLRGHPLPDPDTAPGRLARFFASLTAQERGTLAGRYPLAVGNMNGAPVELRYRANRIALGQARKVERKRMHDPRLTPNGQQDAGRRMHRYESLMTTDRHILAFDPGGSGRVAEVFGNLTRAERVSVVVPGVDTDLLTFQRTSRRYSAPVGMAKALYKAERTASPSTRTAVIAWADYTAPAGIGIDSATAMRAADGAVRLNALVRGLPGSSPVSLFCHSYGSVVCGLAARALPDRVADIAVAGSPGMRVANASHLRTSAQVWAMRDADDWVQDVPYMEVGGFGHGADPMSSAFGARVLSARGADGHSGYFVPGTESLANFAEIGIGAYRTVHCAGDTEACRTGLSGTTTAGRA
ncbi:alpha/beta hydrolase [Streptomyces sp. NPDC006332]|uniref:alpha/beta hydrolase n=1 Tax=Streptomyces sp. NPDC006332 TaxID=3155456 RepID=UPI0033B29D36